MTDFQAPVAEQLFVLDALVGLARLSELPGYEHVDVEIVSELLAESGRLASDVVAPLNRLGDTEGCELVDGRVKTPAGFKQAYEQFIAAGWPAVGFPEAYEGGGFPSVVALAILEQFTAASMAFSLCPILTYSCVEILLENGSETQKEQYLTKLVTGEWTGTMNLTEPDAGSDVGALRMRAEPQADGTYRLFGQKIFITYGSHDFTENTIHIVIARTPDAPAGTKGISCFIVPDRLLDDDGEPGEPNDVRPVSVEHKLGIHASPTCVMSYGDTDGAVGYLIGEEFRGMSYMFTMMNNARLSIAVQGLAISERAYQPAVEYARTREQGRVVGRAAGSAIVGHPDVRRMLMTMRCQIDAMRAVMYRNAAARDVASKHPDAETREHGAGEAALLTPISKGWGTDLGVEMTSLAVQVFGGMGYVEEAGVAQHYRDARIAPIYEGTNGIQAIDLVGRKLALDDGKVIDRYLAEMAVTVESLPP
ncbi:MAG: acyl-CoA dehydrogenase family protein, partial [Acidimicrobiales bacterium]